jgi:hypothetical protein
MAMVLNNSPERALHGYHQQQMRQSPEQQIRQLPQQQMRQLPQQQPQHQHQVRLNDKGAKHCQEQKLIPESLRFASLRSSHFFAAAIPAKITVSGRAASASHSPPRPTTTAGRGEPYAQYKTPRVRASLRVHLKKLMSNYKGKPDYYKPSNSTIKNSQNPKLHRLSSNPSFTIIC